MLIIVSPVVKTICTGGRVQDVREQHVSPDRHRVVVHEARHEQAGAPAEEEVRSELATEIVHLGKAGFLKFNATQTLP